MDANLLTISYVTSTADHLASTPRCTVAKQNTVQRKVYFYRSRLEQETAETGTRAVFDAPAACEQISRMPFVSGERYLTFADGGSLAVWPKIQGSRPRLIFGSLRSSGLPELENDGQFKKLHVEEREKIAEKTHVVFFENGLVGAEFNFYGPRLSRLSYYLRYKNIANVAFDPLLNRDVQETLQHIKDIRVLDLRMRRDSLELLKEAEESLPAALKSWSEKVDAPVVELCLRQKSHSRKALASSILDFVKTLAGSPLTREGVGIFKIQGKDDRTNQVEWFDLLEDKFVSSRQVIKEGAKHRVINSDSMFEEIESAYEELRPQLSQAIGINA
jgi:hypothetical protein